MPRAEDDGHILGIGCGCLFFESPAGSQEPLAPLVPVKVDQSVAVDINQVRQSACEFVVQIVKPNLSAKVGRRSDSTPVPSHAAVKGRVGNWIAHPIAEEQPKRLAVPVKSYVPPVWTPVAVSIHQVQLGILMERVYLPMKTKSFGRRAKGPAPVHSLKTTARVEVESGPRKNVGTAVGIHIKGFDTAVYGAVGGDV